MMNAVLFCIEWRRKCESPRFIGSKESCPISPPANAIRNGRFRKKHLSKIAYLMCICQMPGDIECLSGFKGRHRSAFICKEEEEKRMNSSCVHMVNPYGCKGNWILRFIIPSSVHTMKYIGFKFKIKLSDLKDSLDETMQSINRLIHKICPSRPYVELKLEFQNCPCSHNICTRDSLRAQKNVVVNPYISRGSNLKNISENIRGCKTLR